MAQQVIKGFELREGNRMFVGDPELEPSCVKEIKKITPVELDVLKVTFTDGTEQYIPRKNYVAVEDFVK